MQHLKMVSSIAAAVCLVGLLGGTARAERQHANDIAALAGAKTSLAQAISAVERQKGVKAVKADFREKDGTPVYVVTALSGGNENKTLVDPASGAVLETFEQGFLRRLFDDDAREHAGIGTSKLTLEAAVTMAEQQAGGKAIEAGFKDRHGKSRFEIDLFKDGASREIIIDGTSGQIVKTKIHEDDDDE